MMTNPSKFNGAALPSYGDKLRFEPTSLRSVAGYLPIHHLHITPPGMNDRNRLEHAILYKIIYVGLHIHLEVYQYYQTIEITALMFGSNMLTGVASHVPCFS